MPEAPRIHLTGGRGVQIGDGNTMHVHSRIAWGSRWPEQALGAARVPQPHE